MNLTRSGMLKRYLTLLLCIALPFAGLAARDSIPYSLQHFNDENGLPQNSVKYIATDENGFTWLSTEDGLVRYDGAHFLRYSKDRLGLSSNRFHLLYPGVDGQGIYAANENQEPVKIVNGNIAKDKSPSWLNHFWQLPGLNLSDPSTRIIDGNKPTSGTLRRDYKRFVIPVNAKEFFIYDGSGIFFHDGNQLTQIAHYTARDDWKFFVFQKRLYLLEQDGSIVDFSGQAPARKLLQGDILHNPFFHRRAQEIFLYWSIVSPGEVILYLNQRFYLLSQNSKGQFQTRLLFSGFNANREDIGTIHYKRSTGQLYLGSPTKGLYILSPHSFRTLTLEGVDNVYYAQAVYPKDSSILTNGGVLFNLNKKPEIISNIQSDRVSGFYAVVTDSDGYTWTRFRNMLNIFTPGQFRLYRTWRLPEYISSMYRNKEGNVWLALFYNGGIYRMYNSDQQPELFLPTKETVYTMLQPNDRLLYFCTDSNMYCADLTSRKVDSIPGMKGKRVRSLYQQGQDELWITTYGNGFFLYRNGKLISFPSDRNNYLSSVHCILEDSRGFFWISTNKGLFQVAKADLLHYADSANAPLYYHYYDKTSGFLTNEFNGGCYPCGVKISEGLFSFPSMNGLVLFEPDKLHPNLPDKKIFIDEVTLDSSLLSPSQEYHLPRHFRQLTVQVSSPYFGKSNNLQLFYSLSAKDQQPLWYPVPASGLITISTIPPGNYSLVIRKINGFGKNNYTELPIMLNVEPAWYSTVWFMLLLLVLLGLCSWLFVQLRTVYIRRKNDYLEKSVQAKTRKLQYQHMIQDKIIHAVSHDIRTPLQYQQFMLERLYENMQQEEHFHAANSVKVVFDSVKSLNYMVENMLQYLKGQVSDGTTFSATDLYDITEDKLKVFEMIAKEKNTVLENQIRPGVNFLSNEQLFSVVVHNLLDNSVKITRNGKIIVKATEEARHVLLEISDTGSGLPVTLCNWINQQDAERTAVPTNTGMGLLMVKEITQLLYIRISVSASQQGTKFNLLLPKEIPPA